MVPTIFKKIWKPALKLVLLLAVFGLAFFAAKITRENSFVKELVAGYGYSGIFVVAVISGFNLAVPVPAASFIPVFTAAGLNFWVTVAIIAIGVTLADSIAYLIGKTGHQLVSAQNSGLSAYLEKLRARHSWWPIALLYLFAAFVPIPNEVLVIPLAFAGYKISHLLPALLLGNATFNILAGLGVINLFAVI